MKDKNRTMIKQYFVKADPETGEWLTTPKYVKEVDKAQWDALADTQATHYDTYVVHLQPDDVPSETRAIEVRWENRVVVNQGD